LDDKNVQERINSIFEKTAVDARNEGLKNVAELEKEIASGYIGSPNKYGTYFDYRLKYNQNGLLSVVFLNYQYTGGAHGLTVQSSRTLNLKTGEEYSLKDLVKNDADYVAFISNVVKNEIDARVQEGMLPDYSLAPFEAIRQDQDYYLSNNAVVVYFQQYEYFPYAAGIQEFPVEFSSLKDMLKSDFNFLSNELL
jgi:inhibitor of cysteine peptidase